MRMTWSFKQKVGGVLKSCMSVSRHILLGRWTYRLRVETSLIRVNSQLTCLLQINLIFHVFLSCCSRWNSPKRCHDCYRVNATRNAVSWNFNWTHTGECCWFIMWLLPLESQAKKLYYSLLRSLGWLLITLKKLEIIISSEKPFDALSTEVCTLVGCHSQLWSVK